MAVITVVESPCSNTVPDDMPGFVVKARLRMRVSPAPVAAVTTPCKIQKRGGVVIIKSVIVQKFYILFFEHTVLLISGHEVTKRPMSNAKRHR